MVARMGYRLNAAVNNGGRRRTGTLHESPCRIKSYIQIVLPEYRKIPDQFTPTHPRTGELERENIVRWQQNAVLRAENADLKARLGQDSSNSSKPSSSDGLAKPAPKSLRGSSGRRPGGQSGHEGRTLRQVDEPDVLVTHEPAGCGGCGNDLRDAVVAGTAARQVFDLPDIGVRVTEHRLVSRRRRCGQVTAGAAPDGVDAPVRYGPRVNAAAVYLR